MRNHTIWLHCYERRRNSLNNMVKILQSVCKIAENTISHAIICIRWELHPMKIWTKRSTKCSKVVGKTPINISTWTLIEGKLWNTKQIKYVFFLVKNNVHLYAHYPMLLAMSCWSNRFVRATYSCKKISFFFLSTLLQTIFIYSHGNF